MTDDYLLQEFHKAGHSVDLGKPIFDLKNIKIIPRWKWWLLRLVPTRQATNNGSTISYKRWRGVVYIVGVERDEVWWERLARK